MRKKHLLSVISLLLVLVMLFSFTACDMSGYVPLPPVSAPSDSTTNNGNSTPTNQCTHIEVIDAAVAPTCTATGLTEGKHCSVCGTVLVKQTTTPALVHNYIKCVCEFCGDIKYSVGLAYELNSDGTCYISDIGTCTDSYIYIPEYIDNHKVTGIGSYALDQSPYLKSVGIPGTVTSIGACAFDDCPMLASVTIPNSVTSIGDYAFAYCRNLTSITIPDNVTVIGDMTFNGCTNLTSVTIGKGITSIEWKAFQYCNNLSEITFNGTVAQWRAISFQADWNRNVPASRVICTDGYTYIEK